LVFFPIRINLILFVHKLLLLAKTDWPLLFLTLIIILIILALLATTLFTLTHHDFLIELIWPWSTKLALQGLRNTDSIYVWLCTSRFTFKLT